MIRQDWSSLKKLLFFQMAAGGGAAIEATATGNPLTFVTDLARPLKSLLIPFTPQQEGSGDPSPENIRSILPWNGLKVVSLGENLLVINRNSEYITQGITYTPIKQDNKTVAVRVKGTRTGTNPFFNLNYVDSTTKAIPSGTYKISGGTYGVRVQVFYRDADNVERAAADYGQGATITIPEDAISSWCRIITWTDDPVDIIIYPIIASADSSVTVYPVTFPAPVYGGTLDVVSGVLTVEYIAYTFTANDNLSKYGTYTGGIRLNSTVLDNTKENGVSSVCNIAKRLNSVPSQIDSLCYRISGGTSRTAIFVPDSMFDGGATVDKFKEWLSENEFTICAELVTPQEIPLIPEQITAIKGNNTVWSDADGSMTATYLKKG